MDLLTKIKNFDAYPKTLEDFRIRTLSGAAVSVISGLIILFLFFSEFAFFLQTEVHPQLFVDTSRGEKLRINMEVLFPALPCSYLSVDAMDVAGEHQLDVAHNIFKKRLDKSGNPIAVIKEEVLGGTAPGVVVSINATNINPDCGSCYGAETPRLNCCRTCEDVREAYRLKGWSFTNPEKIGQCIKESWVDNMESQKDEGCLIYGFLLVNKVAGNFHFAPGKSFQQHSMHVHDILPLKGVKFNLTHRIGKLSFGKEFPGQTNPLDGVMKTAEGITGMYQYFIKIVPTIYEPLNDAAIATNQYSVTEYYRALDHQTGGHGLPGVFFMYDLSPIMIRYSERRRSFAHFLTGVCAIIGGVFTVAGIIDSFIYHSMRSLQKKIELGKAS